MTAASASAARVGGFQAWLRQAAFWALVGFVFSIPWENAVQLTGLGSLSRLLGIAALGLGLLGLVGGGRVTLRPPSLFVIVAGAWVLWGVLTYYWSVAPSATLRRGVTMVQLLGMAWLVWEYARTAQQRRVLMQAFVIGVLVTVGVALNVFFSGTGDFREVGDGFDPNNFSVQLAFGLVMVVHLIAHARSTLLRWLLLLYIPVAAFTLVLAASRGGLLAMLAASLMLPVLLRRLGPGMRIGLVVLLTAAAYGLFVSVPAAFPELEANLTRLGATTDELTEGSLTGRRDIWQAGIQVFQEHSFVGVGAGAFPPAVAPLLGRHKVAHNTFLSVLVEQGIIGFALFALLLVTVVASVASRREDMRGWHWVLLLVVLIAIVPLSSETHKELWFVLALVTADRPLLVAAAGDRRARRRAEAA